MSTLRKYFRLMGKLPFTLRGLDYASSTPLSNWQNGIAPALGISAETARDNPLEVFFDNHKAGHGIWKFRHYFDIYHRHFSRFVGKEVHVLEIGVYSGGSLEMWSHYFGPQCHIYGVDIEPACKCYESEKVSISIGDQADRDFWRDFKSRVPRIDILIDDGGHHPDQQIATLEEMLPHLSPGGVYLCEDAHDVHNGFSAYVHGLAKNLNDMTGDHPSVLQKWVPSIHLYPYVTVIEKSLTPLERFEAPKHGTEWQPWGPKNG